VSTPAAWGEVLHSGNYQSTRFNALRHGVLSRYTVLPWEDEAEYQAIIAALVAEHAPQGPTEEHLIEELAGIIWRKRRLRMAEAAIFREQLRHDADSYTEPNIAGAALLPLTGRHTHRADISRAIVADPAQTARELRSVRRDQAMTQRALSILRAGRQDAYSGAVAVLRDDTRLYWHECLEDPPEDGLDYAPTAEALLTWIERRWNEWYEGPINELECRGAIRDQALGAAYAAPRWDMVSRYEVHLDRKLERILGLLARLKELRRPRVEG
jgi:hypothetical protein